MDNYDATLAAAAMDLFCDILLITVSELPPKRRGDVTTESQNLRRDDLQRTLDLWESSNNC